MKNFINISTYRFVPLSDLKPLRERLITLGKSLALKGTILLSHEGINMFVAGAPAAVDTLMATIRTIPGLEDLPAKYSESDHQPFTRMLVRIKKEIIAFGVDGVQPGKYTSRKIPPKELEQWLNEGRPITLLDTRNDYEIKLGTFRNAVPIGVQHFREFPQAVAKLPAELKRQPIVMFCTGGIRCEKAGPFMESQGFEQVFQLDGGILKYFEEVGAKHYQGDCFVFDQRVGVDPTLHETPNSQCFVCLTPLVPQEISDSRYVEGVSCPYCFKTTEEQMDTALKERKASWDAACSPLPGSVPYENRRPVRVSQEYDGSTLIDFVSSVLRHSPRSYWEEAIQLGRFLDEKDRACAADRIVHAGERYIHRLAVQSEPPIATDVSFLYEDEAIVVIDKPAPLPMHEGGRFTRNTLTHLLEKVYAPQKPRPAHRLDANTTGLVVVARTRHFAGIVQAEFSRGEVEKHYLALVQGHPTWDAQECRIPISDAPGVAGSRTAEANGLEACTLFEVIERREDGTALVRARPLTGRTNQIRIHLWSLGLPIVGDPLYLTENRFGERQTLEVGESPLRLHAEQLSFTHPLSRERVSFRSLRRPF